MRFKEGSKVEVTNKEIPESWRVAEIVSGNMHSYNVRYDGYQGMETVSRRFIRPSPPAIVPQSWVIGDIVEVFDENSWKIATVSKVLSGDRFLVRPHGFTHEMIVYKMNIRTRQSWRDGQWIPVGKISGSYGEVKVVKAVQPNCSLKMGIKAPLAGSKICREEDECLALYNDARFQESYLVSKRLKRASPFGSSPFEACPVKTKEYKPADKDHSQRHVSGHSFEKSHNWKRSKQDSIPVLLPFSWKKAVGHVSIHLLQIRQFVAIGTYLNNSGSLISRHYFYLILLADLLLFRPASISHRYAGAWR